MRALMAPEAESRERVIVEAHSWLRTAYHHAARVKGAGVDCAQLLIAVYEAAGLVEGVRPDEYAPEWYLHRGDELFLEWITKYCDETKDPQPGDIALFRFGRATSHAGILVAITEAGPTMIHAYRGRGVVLEELHRMSAFTSRLVGYWTLRRWAQVGVA